MSVVVVLLFDAKFGIREQQNEFPLRLLMRRIGPTLHITEAVLEVTAL